MENNSMLKTNTISKNKISTKDLIESSILIALVFISTKFINITLPISIKGGLIHLGTGMLFISSIVFGAKKGAISGAFGMGLFDILSGWAIWSPFTFIIRGAMGYMIGKIAYSNEKNGNSLKYNVVAMFLSTLWMICGYYISEVILYGNWIQPFTSIPGDILQGVVGGIIAIPIIKALNRVNFK